MLSLDFYIYPFLTQRNDFYVVPWEVLGDYWYDFPYINFPLINSKFPVDRDNHVSLHSHVGHMVGPQNVIGSWFCSMRYLVCMYECVYFILEYIWFTMLYLFQVYRKVIQLYIYRYSFFFRFFSRRDFYWIFSVLTVGHFYLSIFYVVVYIY